MSSQIRHESLGFTPHLSVPSGIVILIYPLKSTEQIVDLRFAYNPSLLQTVHDILNIHVTASLASDSKNASRLTNLVDLRQPSVWNTS
jgi:hypothetical protein